MQPVSATIERLKQSRSLLTVEFSNEAVRLAEEKGLKNFAQNIKIDGFRPGKAPADLVRSRVNPERLFEETIRNLIDQSLPALMKEHSLQPVIAPKVEAVSRTPLTLRITIVERPVVTIRNLDALNVKKREAKADPKDVQKVIDSVMQEHRVLQVVDRAAKEGDQIIVNFSAKDPDGNDVPELRTTAYAVTIGSSRLIPGFEKELTGLKKGDTKTFALPLPEGHALERLQGKKVSFTVEAVRVEEVSLPELTDAFVKDKLAMDSAAAFRSNVEESVRQQEEQFVSMQQEKDLLDAIRKHTQAELAPELIEEEARQLLQEWEERLGQQGMTLDDWMKSEKKTAKDLGDEFRKNGEDRLTLRLGMAKLIENKKIELTDGEKTAAMEEALLEIPEKDRAAAQQQLMQNRDIQSQVLWRALVQKTLASLVR